MKIGLSAKNQAIGTRKNKGHVHPINPSIPYKTMNDTINPNFLCSSLVEINETGNGPNKTKMTKISIIIESDSILNIITTKATCKTNN